MRFILLIGLLFTSLITVAQADSVELKATVQKLDRALLEKDQATLQSILHKDARFGHSNGWIQTRQDVLDDCKSGKLVYNKIENSNTQIIAINKNYATVRSSVNAEGTANGNTFKLSLHVMQVWMKTKKGWLLIARQSAKQ